MLSIGTLISLGFAYYVYKDAKERGVDADRVGSGPVGVEEVGVGQVGDDCLSGDAGCVPVDGHGSLVVGEDSGEDLEQRGFTAAVGTHEADDVPGLQAQASCGNQATCDMSRLAVTPRAAQTFRTSSGLFSV